MGKRLAWFILLIITVIIPATALGGGIDQLYVGELAPLIISDGDNPKRGSAVEVVTEIMAMAGIPYDAKRFEYVIWARALNIVENEPGTGIFCLIRSPQRENKFKWVGPIGRVVLGLFARKESQIRISSAEDLKKYRIGVVRGSASLHVLMNKYGLKESEVHFVKDDDTQLKMLREKRLDLITQTDTGVLKVVKNLDFDMNKYEMVDALQTAPLYLALNKATDDALVCRLQTALDQLKAHAPGKKSRFEQIEQKYRQ